MNSERFDAIEQRLAIMERAFASIMESLNVVDGLCDDRREQRKIIEENEKRIAELEAWAFRQQTEDFKDREIDRR